jgi:hypothetical protein
LALGAWSALTIVVARRPELVLWELARFARAYLVFVLAVNLVRSRADVRRYLDAITAFTLLQGAVSAWQLVQGVYRVHGTFAHSNPLGITMVVFAPLLLAMLLTSRFRQRWRGLALATSALLVVYTRSRASLALLAVGCGAVAGALLIRAALRADGPRLRRGLGVTAVGLALCFPLALKLSDGVLARFREAPESSGESRDRANDAARAMLADHPLGVGLNHYVLALDWGYGEDIEEGDRTIVHHLYWLTGAETGYPGLALLLAVILTFLVSGARAFVRARDARSAAVALGLSVGFAACHLQHLYEWALRKPQVLFQIAVLAGVLIRLEAVSSVRGDRQEPSS